MVRELGAILLLVVVPTAARGEEPARPRPASGAPQAVPECAPQAQPSEPASPQSSTAAADERTFSAELEAFARRRAFTQRLLAKREAEAFEQAILRQERADKLKRELTERERAMAEREVEEAVSLYLRKRELTRELAAAAGGKAKAATGAPTTGAPSSPASSTSTPTR